VDQAELVVEVDDDFHGRGVGTALLQRLATFAHDRGIARLIATTAPEHGRLRRMVRQAGFEAASVFDGRTVRVGFSTAPVPYWWRSPA
jgi:GNAT superfamily N-acetyltransferase